MFLRISKMSTATIGIRRLKVDDPSARSYPRRAAIVDVGS
jgi:hypothetical protein